MIVRISQFEDQNQICLEDSMARLPRLATANTPPYCLYDVGRFLSLEGGEVPGHGVGATASP